MGWPGSDPAAVDHEVVEPLLDMLARADLDADATATAGAARITVTSGGDPAAIVDRVRAALDLRALPADLEPPVIARVDGRQYRYVLHSAELPLRALAQVHERLVVDRLERLSGVGGVDDCGAPDDELAVTVDPARLTAAGIDVVELIDAIRRGNVSVPAGRVGGSGQVTAIDVTAPGEQLGDLVIRADAAVPVRLRDVAIIAPATSTPCRALLDGRPAIAAAVRVHDAAALAAVQRTLHDLAAELPAGTRITWVGRRDDVGPQGPTGLDAFLVVRHIRVAGPGPSDAVLADLARLLRGSPRRTLIEAGPGGGRGPEQVDLWAELVGPDLTDLLEQLRARPGGAVRWVGGPGDLTALLACPEERQLDAAADVLRAQIAETRLVLGRGGAPAIDVHPDRDRLAAHGLTASRIADAIAAVSTGVVAGRWLSQGQPHAVRVRVAVNFPDGLTDVYRRTADGSLVPLSQLVRIDRSAAAPIRYRAHRMPALPVWFQLIDRDPFAAARPLLPAGCRLDRADPDRW